MLSSVALSDSQRLADDIARVGEGKVSEILIAGQRLPTLIAKQPWSGVQSPHNAALRQVETPDKPYGDLSV